MQKYVDSRECEYSMNPLESAETHDQEAGDEERATMPMPGFGKPLSRMKAKSLPQREG